MIAPTALDLFEEELGLPVTGRVIDTWRWGTDQEEVYHRDSDDTFWRVSYRVSTDGEANGLREGECDIEQVVERVEQVKVWVPVSGEEK